MLDYFMKNYQNPMNDIKATLGADEKPLWWYVKRAIQDIEIINLLGLYTTNEPGSNITPFIHCINWKWDPYPDAAEIQDRRRETGDKLQTKYIDDVRIGILSFDIFCGARDKNKTIVEKVIPNKIYVPIEDEQGRFLYGNVLYPKRQIVDQLCYPAKGGYKNGHTLKSLLPIDIRKTDRTVTGIDGEMITGKYCEVKIFTTMVSILSCFMHLELPLSYLTCFPILQFCDRVASFDKDDFYYFKPLEDREIYVKAYKKGVEKFEYIRSVLVMAVELVKEHKPADMNELTDTKWWIWKLSYNENAVEHRGACNEMHVGRMLDTISAEVLPIPECDKRSMMSLLRYSLMSEFGNVNIFDWHNKRWRLNEAISTIVTAEVSAKLKKMFKFGAPLPIADMEQQLKFKSKTLVGKIHSIGIVESPDFTNDLDFFQLLRITMSGPNSLGRNDGHKIKDAHKQLHPSQMGRIDLFYSSKDVGQNGMLTPYGDLQDFNAFDPNEIENIEYDLYTFIENEFPDKRLRFNAKSQEEFKNKLDKLVMSSYINLNYHPLEVDSDPTHYRSMLRFEDCKLVDEDKDVE